MNTLLWLLQIGLAVYFVLAGIVHFALPAGLPQPMVWMYDLAPLVHYTSGTAEILAALGLVLPGLTGIRPGLTPLAAAGLVVVMVLAALFHLLRAEYVNLVGNLIAGGLAAFVAYARWRIRPLAGRAPRTG